jgi:uncharacterized repeat protein (TIGR03803 family)
MLYRKTKPDEARILERKVHIMKPESISAAAQRAAISAYSAKRVRPRGNSSALLFVAVIGLIVTAIAPAQAQTFTVLHTFNSNNNVDGGDPSGDLILVKGVLYGTTTNGGNHHNGTVFKVAPTGTETILYNFGTNTVDGKQPMAGLVRDGAGNIYGTTFTGGTTGTKGTVFKVTGKKEKLLHNFTGTPDGEAPLFGSMVLDSGGNLYGTTNVGGKGTCSNGCGTVFKINSAGKETILHSFQNNGKDGMNPYGGLILDSTGNLYGTTNNGGNTRFGTVFTINTSTGKEKVLHSFKQSDGQGPLSRLVRDSGGNLYGTTYSGGVGSSGTVFKLTPSGHLTTLYSFTGLTDGGFPWGGLVLDAKGNLYGTTTSGGGGSCSGGCGVIFKVAPKGKETVLWNFDGGAGGFFTYAGLVRDTKGNLYGNTFYGGDGGCNCGIVYKLAP